MTMLVFYRINSFFSEVSIWYWRYIKIIVSSLFLRKRYRLFTKYMLILILHDNRYFLLFVVVEKMILRSAWWPVWNKFISSSYVMSHLAIASCACFKNNFTLLKSLACIFSFNSQCTGVFFVYFEINLNILFPSIRIDKDQATPMVPESPQVTLFVSYVHPPKIPVRISVLGEMVCL